MTLSNASFCWMCGKKLAKVSHATRVIHGGLSVRMHKCCAKTFDADLANPHIYPFVNSFLHANEDEQ